MIKELTILNGVSGNEENVASFVCECVKKSGCHYEFLPGGNLIVYKKGKKTPSKKFMIFAHMDEVGFIVTKITDEGFLKFDTIGSVDERILLSKKVYVGENNIPGIIGVKAIHLTSKEDRKKSVDIKDMYIDIGAVSKEDAMSYVRLGDYVSFDGVYYQNEKRIFSKAIDDRVGVAVLLEMIMRECEYDFTACFDVMEEVGARGALTSSEYIKPDYALILEGTTCSDLNKTPENMRSTVLGDGPALSVRDMGTCYSEKFNSFIISLAESNSVKYQLKKTHRGGNDSSAVQSAGIGSVTAVISLPVRYIHSPTGVMDTDDYENMIKLTSMITDSIGEF